MPLFFTTAGISFAFQLFFLAAEVFIALPLIPFAHFALVGGIFSRAVL
jgi:hypothetical protein